ncbi:flagellar filament capping protein FliD [Kurthia huakuii]|uniref:flagellar filament capping protein FliD n=1 Tax=Kurthia huakuii TaxID=1421019 RepID=UPI000495B95F|nr:flagellar filament capping protein FliD [Kurthia huakuii]MBM7700754.1 flagellar hook-associated protein 2 [Kurthia huakuii]
MPVENNTSTQTAFSYLQYKNKVSGLVSGMDIDSIMEKLMKAESAQMEKLQQQKQKYEWKRDAYRDVNTKLSTFEKNAFTDYGLKSSWNMKNVSASNESASAVATSSANGTLNITEGKLATAAQSVVDMSSSNITADSTMASLGMTSSSGSFSISAIDNTGNLVEKTISYASTDKVSDVMSKINASGVGITALASGDKLSLTANNEGTVKDEDGNTTKQSMFITKDDNGLFAKLGVLAEGSKGGDIIADKGANATITEGSNGYVVANGVKIEGTSNKYTISGYQVTLNKNITTNDAATKITSTNDTDKVVDKVKKFVDSYNELIADLGKQTAEKKKVGYAPLTDAQKAEMSKDEIEKWEVAAKQGLLKGDSTINKVLSDLRSTLSTYGSGSEDMLAKIGITTSKSYKDNGKLEIDEDKLRKALESDPDVVSRIFTGDGNGNDGIVSKMRTTAQNAVKTIQKTAGSATSESDATYSLGKTITSLDNKIDDWKDRLKGIEERYWKQFSAMENAIQKANSQSSIFMQ